MDKIFHAMAAAAGVNDEVNFGVRFADCVTPVSTVADTSKVLYRAGRRHRHTAAQPSGPSTYTAVHARGGAAAVAR